MREEKSLGETLAHAAAQLVGTPFLLHGRDPSVGLDCVGLVYASLSSMGRIPVAPTGYKLRNSNPSRWLVFAEQAGLKHAVGPTMPGDIILTNPGPAQTHLVIVLTHDRIVHAHAGLRRVVIEPMKVDSIRLAQWRIA